MKKLMIALAIVAIASVAQAEILATWSFNGSNSTDWYNAAPVSGSGLAANINSAELSFGAGFTPSASANTLRASGTGWGGVSRTIDLSDTSYVQLDLVASSGYTLTVEDIATAGIGSSTGQNGTDRWAASADGGAYAFVTAQANYGGNGAKSYDITDTTGEEVSLRYFASPTSTTGTWGFNSANAIVVNGTTQVAAVPEPATMSLLGLGALAMVLRRKIRK